MGFLKKLKEKVGMTEDATEKGSEAGREAETRTADVGSSAKDTINEVKSEQSLMSKIQDVLLFGKGTREDLKEFDMQLREDYNQELSGIRQRWEEVYLEILDQQPSLNRRFKTIIQTIDRVKAQVNRATYGYAPLFNRTGQIGSNELATVFNYDKMFGEYLNQLKISEDNVAKNVEAKDWKAVSDGVDNMKAVLADTESRWKEREQYFRSKEVSGPQITGTTQAEVQAPREVPGVQVMSATQTEAQSSREVSGSQLAGTTRTETQPPQVVLCSECGSQNSAGQKFCGNCGKPLQQVEATCPKCGTRNVAGTRFCGNCGERMP